MGFPPLPNTRYLLDNGWEVAEVAPSAQPGAGVYLTLNSATGSIRQMVTPEQAREYAAYVVQVADEVESARDQQDA